MAGRLSRFLNLEGARPKSPATTPPLGSRFDDDLQAKRRAQLESGLVLDEHTDDEQPFVRCGQCETDSARGTLRCKTCGAELDTPQQRAFNEQLWQQRRADRETEQAESASRAKEHAPETAPAANVANRRPLGLRLLARIPNPRWRLATSIVLVLLAGFLVWRTLTTLRGEGNPLVQLALFALLFLFFPVGRRGFFGRRTRW